ncbi:MAG: MBL fold metallo-hydrolase, partial [Chloroflexota bacterium]
MARAQLSRASLTTLAALLSAAAFAGCSVLAPSAPPEHVTLALPEPPAAPPELIAPSELAVQHRPEPVEGPTPASPGLLARLNWNDEFGERTIVFDTVSGIVKLRQVGAGSLMLKFGETVVHVNPWSGAGEYESLPKADQIWITDPSPEHLDLHAIRAISTESTQLIVDPQSARLLRGLLAYTQLQSQVLVTVDDLEVMAFPTFWAEMLPDGPHLNPGNSYLASYGEFRLFLAGQAHYIPGLQGIDEVDVALLSVDDIRSLSAKQAAEITLWLSPSAVLPYQYSDDDPAELAELLADSGTMVLPLNTSEQAGPQPIGVPPDRSLSIAGLYLESEEPDPALLADLFGAAEQVNPLMLPDLRTLTPSSLYITHNSYTNTTLLRLTNSVSNTGYGPLELWGRVSEDGATHSVAQRIFQADGSYQERLMG